MAFKLNAREMNVGVLYSHCKILLISNCYKNVRIKCLTLNKKFKGSVADPGEGGAVPARPPPPPLGKKRVQTR